MFDVGISEIAVIGVVALVVLGPERLPKVARTAGHMFGRLQRYVANVKADINREMEMSDFSKVKEEVQSAVKSFEQTIHEHANAVNAEAAAIEKSAGESVGQTKAPPTPVALSQIDLLTAQEEGLPLAATEKPTTTMVERKALETYSPVQTAQQSFDLGIETPRRISR
ncbi:MAG: twin-arginine translocase subunit TatB [Aeromicrobium sp.]|nr:twin-arginine translocase subunit TatB [Burkholderiales bacterium]